MDVNQFTLIGRIGSSFKYAKAQSGNTYAYFSLEVEPRALAKENDYRQILHVMVFNKKIIDYMKAVEAKRGNRVVVVGYCSSFSNEVNGKMIISNTINAKGVFVIKTPPRGYNTASEVESESETKENVEQ